MSDFKMENDQDKMVDKITAIIEKFESKYGTYEKDEFQFILDSIAYQRYEDDDIFR